jgi:phage terminase large subunit GpA-like protein
VSQYLASAADVIAAAKAAWRLPPRLSLAEWADENFVLSAQNSAEAGRWKCIPYQREILDAISDPAVTHVSFCKSARVGATKMMCVAIAYHIAQDPTSMMFVQPTIEAAAQFSKEEIAVMLNDVPALSGLASSQKSKDSDSTIAHKTFRGGALLSLVGANSGNSFRRVSRRIIFMDEVDSYPASAGSDGDPVKLASRRSDFFWNRKIVAASTPLVAGVSRIEQMFHAGDQRRYHVPCPQCGHKDIMVFSQGQRGHHIEWPRGEPEKAFLVCSKNGCTIEHSSKRDMVAAGEWIADAPFTNHASFHISALYSYSPNSTWGDIAKEFVDATKGGSEQLRVFVNTVLGEVWKEAGEAPDWERLYQRRESYQIGTVPEGAQFLTAGVDVQHDRWEYEVVGWGAGKQSWSVDSGVIPGNPSEESEWAKIDELLSRSYPNASGDQMAIWMLAVDSGDNTQMVYNWARFNTGRVIAVKGSASAKSLLGSPTAVDVTVRGKRITRGCKVWMVGTEIAKNEIYGWLGLPSTSSSGFCHFPEYGEDYFKQLTAEQLVSTKDRKGYMKREWQVIPGRRNERLDCRVYARAAASVGARLDRMPPLKVAPVAASPTPEPVAARNPATPAALTVLPKPPPQGKPRSDSRFHGFRGSDWLRKKR